MSAPTWDQYMAPSLQVLLNGEIKSSRGIVEGAAELLGITDLSWTSLVPQLPEHLCGGFGDRGLCLELLVADADGDVLQGS